MSQVLFLIGDSFTSNEMRVAYVVGIERSSVHANFECGEFSHVFFIFHPVLLPNVTHTNPLLSELMTMELLHFKQAQTVFLVPLYI
jgi:hypothetical protein